MKRKVFLLPLAAALTLAAPAFAQEYMFAFEGFSYDVPGGGSTHYLDIGDQYVALGYVTAAYPGRLDGVVDFGTNEYTYHFYDLTALTSYFAGGYLEVTFNNATGRMRFYEDPIAGGTHADYGTNPPDAPALASFTDGVIMLGGKARNCVFTYDFNNEVGFFTAVMDLDEGTELAIYPLDRRDGWVVSAGLRIPVPPPDLPTGYDHQAVGANYLPATPTIHKTWGAIKALYR